MDDVSNVKYSVLMSVYAGENAAYLRQSLDCMAAQTVPPDEIVLVFDGPLSDALENVVADFAADGRYLPCQM